MTWYTPAEVAQILKLDQATVRRACAAGKIDAAKPFGKWRISEEALQAFIDASKPKRDPGVLKPPAARASLDPAEKYRSRLRRITRGGTTE